VISFPPETADSLSFSAVRPERVLGCRKRQGIHENVPVAEIHIENQPCVCFFSNAGAIQTPFLFNFKQRAHSTKDMRNSTM
jgi:hypothetical protein